MSLPAKILLGVALTTLLAAAGWAAFLAYVVRKEHDDGRDYGEGGY